MADDDPVGGPGLARGQLVAGRYRIDRLIGRGGMSEIYRAADVMVGAEVALKTLPGHRQDGAESLRRELGLGRRVSHPNVCRMFDLGTVGDLEFVTMELLEGETLADRLARAGRLELDAALPLLRQIAAGLAALHEAGIVHRDLKPGNVMLVGERAVVTDFGLARLLEAPATGSGTMAAGTPAYLAPEQLRGEPATPRTDVYAFGVVAYEVLAGRLPFLGDTPAATAMMRLARDPPRLDEPHLDRVLRGALARAPADRFASPLEVVAALEARPSRRSSRRALIGAAAVAIAAGAGYGGWRAMRGDRAPGRAPAVLIGFGGLGADNVDDVVAFGDDLVIGGKGGPGARLGDRALTESEGGARSGMVARIRADGHVRWMRAISGPEDVRLNAVAVSADGRVAIGGFTYGAARGGGLEVPDPAGISDGFLAMLDGETGAIRWWHAISSTDAATVRAMAFDEGGALYVVGELSGTTRFPGGIAREAPGPSGSRSPYVASWARDGALRWVTAGRGAADTRAFALAVDGGEVLAAGMLAGTTAIGGLQLPATSHGDGYLLRLDAAGGGVRSGRLLHGTATVSINAAIPAGVGGAIIAGNFRGVLAARPDQPMAAEGRREDGFVARLSADGAAAWTVHVAGPLLDRVMAVAMRGDRIVAVGQFAKVVRIGDRTLHARGLGDMVYAELGLDGRVVRAEAIGGPGEDRARGLTIAPEGGAIVSGFFSLDLGYGGATLRSHGSADGVVVRVDQKP